MANETTWSVVLLNAKESRSERLFQEALKLAEEEFGSDSSEVGLCLIEFADLLEELGRTDEALVVTERYRKILIKIASNIGLLSQDDLE